MNPFICLFSQLLWIYLYPHNFGSTRQVALFCFGFCTGSTWCQNSTCSLITEVFNCFSSFSIVDMAKQSMRCICIDFFFLLSYHCCNLISVDLVPFKVCCKDHAFWSFDVDSNTIQFCPFSIQIEFLSPTIQYPCSSCFVMLNKLNPASGVYTISLMVASYSP